ncbi:MAG: methyltransferase domain-containing protein [Cytophagales bacterium]|nr:methyltransferase domain-containing protein [Cytophagales bacterium]
MTKLHKNICEAIVNALENIFIHHKYTDKVIEHTLKSDSRWGSRDRKFIAENIYEIVRYLRYIQNIGNIHTHDYWAYLGTWLAMQDTPLPDWQEFHNLDIAQILHNKQYGLYPDAVMQSFPDWLFDKCSTEIGSPWLDEVIHLNTPAKLVIRTNTLKTNIYELQSKLLNDYGFATTQVPHVEHALVFDQKVNIFQTALFKEGYFEIQDISSQLVASYLSPNPGMRVVDACAGAGGKSLHIAALMQNKGQIISMDVSQWKLDELKKRARRAGVYNIETRLIDGYKNIKRLAGMADRLLLDVPCSGLGVLRRNPDAKWKLTDKSINDTIALQQEILDKYHTMLKPGALMVYATCSILPSENEHQIKMFLENNSNFELVKQQTIWPSQGYDGFFMALVKKK